MREPDASAVDAVFTAVADHRRRQILLHASESEEEWISVDDLVDNLVEREGESPVDREDVAVSLYHMHLPKLSRVGAIDYDAEREALRYQVDPLLERVLDVGKEMETVMCTTCGDVVGAITGDDQVGGLPITCPECGATSFDRVAWIG